MQVKIISAVFRAIYILIFILGSFLAFVGNISAAAILWIVGFLACVIDTAKYEDEK